MIELTMPRLGLTMDEGTIAEWHKKAGESFREGEPLFAVETDKATLDVEAEYDGVLKELIVPVGGKVAVGTPIARIETSAAPAPARGAEKSCEAEARTAEPVRVTPPVQPSGDARLKTSPAVRRRAREEGVDLNAIKGSGPGGRIVLRDLPADVQTSASANVENVASGSRLTARSIPLSAMRRAIAASMTEAAAIPQFRVTRTVDMTRTLALRNALRPVLNRAQTRISVTDFLLHACALALASHPEINASYVRGAAGSGDGLLLHEQVNIGVAVAVPDGLMVPVLRDANRLTLIETAKRREELVEAAQSGRLNAPQMTDATFTLSNLGPMGVDQFDAIVTPPQAAVLAAGRVLHQPVVDSRERVQVRPAIILTLTSDHRVIDGAMAAKFIGTVAKILEETSEYRLF